MAGRRVYGGSDMNVLLQNDGICVGPFEGFMNSSSSSHSAFNGSRSILTFEEARGGTTANNQQPFYRAPREIEEAIDEDLDEYSCSLQQPEKKRRLSANQVQFLEKSFEVENKLEPERKIQLAKDLGLQPRQVVIWFQNRRARWKTKQIEKDFDVLKSSYNALKLDYENLLKEKDKLKSEVVHLTDKLLLKEKKKKSTTEPFDQFNDNPPVEVKKLESQIVGVKQEDHSSTNSLVLDSADSPRSNVLDQSNTSCLFGEEEEEEEEVKGYTQFLKIEDNSVGFDFGFEDHNPFWFWT